MVNRTRVMVSSQPKKHPNKNQLSQGKRYARCRLYSFYWFRIALGSDGNCCCDYPSQVRWPKDSVWEMGAVSWYSDNFADRPSVNISDIATVNYPTPLSRSPLGQRNQLN